MAETFEGRYWYNEKLPVLYIIADKMPNVNRDNVIISFIKKNKEQLKEYILKAKLVILQFH